jgi:3-keto-disaccharide hydrolase
MSIRLVLSLSVLVCLGSVNIACAAHGAAFTDPAKAGPDFAVQGEYTGEGKFGGDTKPVGMQVVALGKGEFDAVLYVGGLPGEGWSRGGEKRTAKGKTSDGETKFSGDGWLATLKDGKVTATKPDGEKLGELKKIERKSPTLGAKPPEGAVVLFDGSNVDHWNSGKIVEDHLLWNGPSTKDQFGDHTLHVEFRCPFMPEARGQGRGNSGVYLQERYEVQVLDSFGLEGLNNDCGGIYQIAQEKVNMSFPPLAWQTYDIDVTAARFDASGKKTSDTVVTIKHNGVVVHDNLKLPHQTPGRIGDETPKKGSDKLTGGIYLQDHGGDPVVFRNIWVVEKK